MEKNTQIKKKANEEEKLVISPEGAVRVSLAGREWWDGGGRVHGHPTNRPTDRREVSLELTSLAFTLNQRRTGVAVRNATLVFRTADRGFFVQPTPCFSICFSSRNRKRATELTEEHPPVQNKSNIKLNTTSCSSFMHITCKTDRFARYIDCLWRVLLT